MSILEEMVVEVLLYHDLGGRLKINIYSYKMWDKKIAG